MANYDEFQTQEEKVDAIRQLVLTAIDAVDEIRNSVGAKPENDDDRFPEEWAKLEEEASKLEKAFWPFLHVLDDLEEKVLDE